MDLDILEFLDDAIKESNSFEKHPGVNFSLEEKTLYLHALSLVMNVDGEIHENEKEYVRILLKSFDLDESMLDTLLAFAKSPDKDSVQDFFKTFRRRPIAQLFLFDALMLSRRDKKVNERENTIIDKMANQLEILQGTQKDIYDLFCHIQNRNWQESALYFSSHLLNPEHFKHLLSYHEVDFDELMEEMKNIRRNRLLENIRIKNKALIDNFAWEKLRYDTEPDKNDKFLEKLFEMSRGGELKISSDLLDFTDIFSYEVLLPFIQTMLDRGELRVIDDKVYKIDKDIEDLYFNTNDFKIFYDKEHLYFYVNSDVEKNKKCIISHKLIVDYLNLLFPGFDFSKPMNINTILGSLTGCTISYGAKYPNDKDVCLPNIVKINEILLTHNGHFIKRPNNDNYIRASNIQILKLTCIDVLLNEKIRLIRLP